MRKNASRRNAKAESIINNHQLVHGFSLGGTYAEILGRDQNGEVRLPMTDRTLIYLHHKIRSRGILWEVIAEKNSLLLTAGDYRRLEKSIFMSSAKAIVIACVTFRLRKVAMSLKQNRPVWKGKTVSVFGAFNPLWSNLSIDGTGPPDAPFNLGIAIMCSLTQPEGVYVPMHGRVYTPERVRKHLGDGLFDVLTEQEADDFTEEEVQWHDPSKEPTVEQLMQQVAAQKQTIQLQALSTQQLVVLVEALALRLAQQGGLSQEALNSLPLRVTQLPALSSNSSDDNSL